MILGCCSFGPGNFGRVVVAELSLTDMLLHAMVVFKNLFGLSWQELPSGSNIVLKQGCSYVDDGEPRMQVTGELLPPLVSLTKECEVCDIELLLHSPCSVNVRHVRSPSLGFCVMSGTYIQAIAHEEGRLAVAVYGFK
jgi:hypothetical protein